MCGRHVVGWFQEQVEVQIGEDCQASCGARVIVRASRIASWIEQLHLIHYIEAIAN